MPGESVPQGLWLPPRVATLFVAANNALDRSRAQADFLCDGIADDVQINEALNALPAGVEGRVVLSEGTFNIVNPIVIPANNITVRGQGRSTFIDGDGLATGEHGIVISGVTSCCIKKLAIQTENGGGKTCHCIFVEDGANNFEIEYVTIVNSDSDGIHIEGTSILFGYIHNCHIEGADDYGIQVNPAAANFIYRLHIVGCDITATGISGIYFAGRCHYALLEGNIVFLTGLEGIQILTSHHSTINNNISYQNTQDGISITSTDHCSANNNICYNNTRHGISLNNSDECILEGNICTLNDSGDTATYNGIYLNNTSTDNLLTGNHCCNNHNYGIACYGARNNIVGNFCHENDQHGIHIAAAECSINGNYVYHNSVDGAGTYHGINLAAGADKCQVNSNFCNDNGALQEDGIHLEDGASEVQIVGNRCYNGMGDGIQLVANNDYCLIKDNYCSENDDYGIAISAATCDHNIVENNELVGNVTGQISDGGTDTTLPFISVAVPNPSSNIGEHPSELLTDGLAVISRFRLPIPAQFQELVRAYVIIVPGGTGNLRRSVATDFGKICTAEVYNTHSGALADDTNVAVTINQFECVDISGALAGIVALDEVGVGFTRHGENALDTVNANCHLLELRMEYV